MVFPQKTPLIPYPQNLWISPYIKEKLFFFLCRKKKPSSSLLHVCSLCISFSTDTEHFASDAYGQQTCMYEWVGRGYSHHAILCDTIWVSCNSTQFWHYLHGDNVTCHKWRAPSHKIASTPLHMPIINCRSPGYPQLLFDLVTNWRFPYTSLPRLVNLLVQLTELRETLAFTSLLKDMTKHRN